MREGRLYRAPAYTRVMIADDAIGIPMGDRRYTMPTSYRRYIFMEGDIGSVPMRFGRTLT